MADSNTKSKGKTISDMYDSNYILKSLESNSNNPTDKSAVDLLKTIRDLQQQVMEQKIWAQQEVSDAACRLTNDYIELHTLRGLKADQEKIENNSTEEYVQHVNCEANMIADAVRRLDMKNAQIRADTQALKLSGSESDKDLLEVLQREKKFMKEIAHLEKQAKNIRAQCEDEELRVLEMERELAQAEREAMEVQLQWKQETRDKESVLALLAEETKSDTHKARSRTHLSKLRREVETEAQVAEDERRRLEDELARLHVSCTVEDLLPKYDEATSSESSARSESNCRICMICMQNQVSVVLLPCTHQVLCFLCYEKNCGAVVAGSPYCHVEIKQSIKVYGPSS